MHRSALRPLSEVSGRRTARHNPHRMSVEICRLDELSDPGARGFAVGRGDWPLRGFVVRRGSEVYAYVNRCPHQGHPLNLRPDEFLSRDRAHILCSSHGAVFELEKGVCVVGPCPGRALISLPVRVCDGVVLLDGDADDLANRYA